MATEEFNIDKILSEIDEDEQQVDQTQIKREVLNEIEFIEIENDALKISSAHVTDESQSESAIEEKANLEAILNDSSDISGDESGITEEPEIKSEPLEEKRSDEPSPAKESNENLFQSRFTIVGTKAWNRKEPYIIQLDGNRLETDCNNLKNSFYFTPATNEKEANKDDMKSSLARYMRKSGHDITSQYQEFIYKIITSINNDLAAYFGINDDIRNIFIYHIGSLSIYKIVNEKFIIGKFGYCYKYDLHSAKVIRFMPDEFIKEKVLTWYEDNINSLHLPFDSIQNFDKVFRIIEKSYSIVKRNFLIRLDELNNKLAPGKKISSKDLLKLKGNKWFGIQNIIIYRRFLDRTIF